MLFEVSAYFAGPDYTWSGKPSERERLCTHPHRWLWAARAHARQLCKMFDTGRIAIDIHRVEGKERSFVESWVLPTVQKAGEIDHGLPFA